MGHREQVAENRGRTLLAPEGALADIAGSWLMAASTCAEAVHAQAGGKLEAHRLAVVRRVGLGSEPGDHVAAAVGDIRQDETNSSWVCPGSRMIM